MSVDGTEARVERVSLLIFSRLNEKEAIAAGGIIHFTVMDHDLMWSNDFEGEAFLDLSKLPGIPHESSHDNRPLDELKQIELPLTHPKGCLPFNEFLRRTSR